MIIESRLKKFRWGIALAAAAALFLVGCGGGDDSDALTKQEFVKRGNAICEQGVKEKDQILQAGLKEFSGKEPGRKDLEGLVLEMLPPLAETVQRLRELPPPVGDEKVVEAFLQEYEQALKKAEAQPERLVRVNFFTAPDQAAQAYGLTSCNL